MAQGLRGHVYPPRRFPDGKITVCRGDDGAVRAGREGEVQAALPGHKNHGLHHHLPGQPPPGFPKKFSKVIVIA